MIPRNRKPSEEVVVQYESAVIACKQEISELEEILKIKETSFWEVRQKRLKEKFELVELELDKFQGMTERDIILFLAERLMLRKEISSNEDCASRISELRENISNYEKEIDERRKRLGTQTA